MKCHNCLWQWTEMFLRCVPFVSNVNKVFVRWTKCRGIAAFLKFCKMYLRRVCFNWIAFNMCRYTRIHFPTGCGWPNMKLLKIAKNYLKESRGWWNLKLSLWYNFILHFPPLKLNKGNIHTLWQQSNSIIPMTYLASLVLPKHIAPHRANNALCSFVPSNEWGKMTRVTGSWGCKGRD